MSRRALLAVLLIYVDCWKSIYVGNYSVCLKPHVFTCKVSSNAFYDEFRYCRCGVTNQHLSCFPLFCVFNVALQDLGPIDRNYILVVGVFYF